ncbi:transposase [Streptomyces qinglanensis]|uniref:transposase n=1 Tax=Streptomyces qinglanensis TaxID=943816 RepID=UPI003B84881E
MTPPERALLLVHRSFGCPVRAGRRRCGRWRDHQPVTEGILHRVRTGVQWRDRPEPFGPWTTVHERHRLWSADGTGERLLQQVRPGPTRQPRSTGTSRSIPPSCAPISTRSAFGPRHRPAPVKGAEVVKHQDSTPWQSMVDRLVKVVHHAQRPSAVRRVMP